MLVQGVPCSVWICLRCCGEVVMLTLRPVQKSDAKTLMSLRNGADTFKWFYSNRQFTLKEVENWIDKLDPNRDIVLMVEQDNQIVGTIMLMVEQDRQIIGTVSIYNIEDKRAEVGRVIVSEGIRGKGIGTAILLQLVPIAKERGIELLYANIKTDNIRSCRAFEKAGYVRIEERPETGYYYEFRLKD